MPSDIQSHEGRLLASMLESQGRQLERIDETLQRVGSVLENFGRIEERVVGIQRDQVTNVATLAAHEGRLKIVEVEMPALKEIRRWVIGGVVSFVSLIGTGVVMLMVNVVKFVH